MDCKVYKCENNNGYGYCECINYITIDENGCCESMFVRETEEEKAVRMNDRQRAKRNN